MKLFKNYMMILILVVAVFFISGCGQSCPQCPQPNVWSECNDNAVKTRANYKCGEDTNFQCQSYTEESQCKTQISLTGSKGLNTIVSPTVDESVKGIIKLDITSIPSGVSKIWVMMGPQGRQPQPGEDPFKMPNTIMQIEDAVSGKVIFLDTTKVENGVYNLGVMATSNPNGAPWTDIVQTQLIVKN
jgi:hypothetical protein